MRELVEVRVDVSGVLASDPRICIPVIPRWGQVGGPDGTQTGPAASRPRRDPAGKYQYSVMECVQRDEWVQGHLGGGGIGPAKVVVGGAGPGRPTYVHIRG